MIEEAALFYRIAHRVLIHVGRRRIDQPITCLKGIQDASFAFIVIGYLVDPESQNRHFDTVV